MLAAIITTRRRALSLLQLCNYIAGLRNRRRQGAAAPACRTRTVYTVLRHPTHRCSFSRRDAIIIIIIIIKSERHDNVIV